MSKGAPTVCKQNINIRNPTHKRSDRNPTPQKSKLSISNAKDGKYWIDSFRVWVTRYFIISIEPVLPLLAILSYETRNLL